MKHTPQSAREVMAASIGNDPYLMIEDLRRVGKVLAEKEGIAYQLQQETKPLLATIQSEYANAHAKTPLSEAKLERLARADPRFTVHIRGTASAIQEREEAKNEFWAIKSELEWDRASIAHLNSLSRIE